MAKAKCQNGYGRVGGTAWHDQCRPASPRGSRLTLSGFPPLLCFRLIDLVSSGINAEFDPRVHTAGLGRVLPMPTGLLSRSL